MLYYLILESVTFTREPTNPTIVIEGVNSSRVLLIWAFSLGKGEMLESVSIERARPGENSRTTIATRPSANDSFIFARDTFRTDYGVRLPATFVLKRVQRTDDYMYFLTVFYSNSLRPGQAEATVSVVAFGKYQNRTLVPRRRMIFRVTEWKTIQNHDSSLM